MFIKLDEKNIDVIGGIDFESNHQMESHLTIDDYKNIAKNRFEAGNEEWFGLKIYDIIVGYVTLKDDFPGHKHCEVYWLSVRNSFQGKGYGKKLMFFIEDYAKKKGFRKVCLYTNKEMLKTRGFYERIGYELVNEFPDYYSDGGIAVLYAKKL